MVCFMNKHVEESEMKAPVQGESGEVVPFVYK